MTSINSCLMCRNFSVGQKDNPQGVKNIHAITKLCSRNLGIMWDLSHLFFFHKFYTF